MSDLDDHIKRLNDKLQSLLKNHYALVKENERLKNDAATAKIREKEYRAYIDNVTQKVNILQASAGKMKEEDQREFEKRINQYIKEIDKCIVLLSE